MEAQKSQILNSDQKIRGVNLGSWLLYEHWMSDKSPVHDAVSGDIGNRGELIISQTLGKDKTDDLFNKHRQIMITEDDIKQIADAKFNAVRIPVGWFIKKSQNKSVNPHNLWNNYGSNALDYLDKLINEWCPKQNVFVLISLHAAIGAQSCCDHSAGPGTDLWSSYKENVDDSKDTVKFLVDRYKTSVAFIGIGLLNEPSQSQNNDILKQYYLDCYNIIRKDCASNCLISYMPKLQDQNLEWSTWKQFFQPPNFQGCMFEIHCYECFNPSEKTSLDVWNSVNYRKQSINNWKFNWLNVGEYSLAAPGEANISSKQDLQNFWNQQKDSMTNCKATFFWSWKMFQSDNSPNGWSLKTLIDNKIVS